MKDWKKWLGWIIVIFLLLLVWSWSISKPKNSPLPTTVTTTAINPENQLPDGVRVTHMANRSLKNAPWRFMGWEIQGGYVFPLIANDSGKPTPIRSAVPPPDGSLPSVPEGEWVLADWQVNLPDGTQLALNGWAKRR
jgi:hypothetical protein